MERRVARIKFTVSEVNGFVSAWTLPSVCSELLVTELGD
jgi:hypothetical protein